MGIPTRTQWVNLKKQNKIKDGAAKGVNMGQLLENYDKAFNKDGRLGAIRQLGALMAGAKKYHEATKAAYPNFAPTFKTEMLDEVVDLQTIYDKMANPAAKLGEAFRGCLAALAHLGDNPTKNQLDLFVTGPVRNVGTVLPVLARIEPKAAELRQLWDPFNTIDTTNPKKALKILKAGIALVVKEARASHLLRD